MDRSAPETETAQRAMPEAQEPPTEENRPTSELEQAQETLARAERRLLTAAIAFCEGLISDGQLRAVREMHREQELRLAKLEGEETRPFVEPEAPPTSQPTSGAVPIAPLPTQAKRDRPQSAAQPSDLNAELRTMLTRLDEKIAQLEADFQQGRINASQYRAIRRHYMEQHEVALRLHQANPHSDRWRVVLEEGKTSFLMQLNEAECRCIAFYDLESQDCIFMQGELPTEAKEAMRFLSTFGQRNGDSPTGRMFATQTEDGANLLLIPGRFMASLVAFSDEPPGWQVRALREVLRNFEAANSAALGRGERQTLVFPNLNRFFRS